MLSWGFSCPHRYFLHAGSAQTLWHREAAREAANSFPKNAGHLHEISNLYSAKCSQQAQSKYQSAQLTARSDTVPAHCAHTLPAPHCARKIASKIPDFADKTSDFADKTLDFATKICERSGRTVRACERTVRACGQQCLYTAAQI